MTTLAERMTEYENDFDYSLIKRLPVIVRINGKKFSKVTRKLLKPYDPAFAQCMVQAMLDLLQTADGSVFGFHHNDEVTLILRNDHSLGYGPWYGNNIEKISSIAASSFTFYFLRAWAKSSYEFDFKGDLIFSCKTLVVPSYNEAVNYLVWRQQLGLRQAINSMSQVVLSSKLSHQTAIRKLTGLSSSEKIKLVDQECGVNFEDDYPNAFKFGVVAYKSLVERGSETRRQWQTNWDLSKIQGEQRDFIEEVITFGYEAEIGSEELDMGSE